MAMNLHVRSRSNFAKSHLRELRHAGYIPGVVYGKSISGTPVEVNRIELSQIIRKSSKHALVKLSIDGGSTLDAMLHDLQIDPLDRQIIHVDFHQIRKGEKVNTVLPLQLIGTPVGVKDGGVISQQLTELEIRCLPEEAPLSIEIPISDLGIGDQLRVSDIHIPDGIELRTHEDELILSITPPKLDPVDEAEQSERPELVDEQNGPGIDV